MNQMVGTKPDGSSFVALALEPGNFVRLKKGQPIVVHLESFFPDGIPERVELAILYTETPVADARQLAGMASMAFDERSAKNVRPHCPECGSSIEQLGMMRGDTPVHTVFCAVCGCVLGVVPKET